jgi:hypothetical protein
VLKRGQETGPGSMPDLFFAIVPAEYQHHSTVRWLLFPRPIFSALLCHAGDICRQDTPMSQWSEKWRWFDRPPGY